MSVNQLTPNGPVRQLCWNNDHFQSPSYQRNHSFLHQHFVYFECDHVCSHLLQTVCESQLKTSVWPQIKAVSTSKVNREPPGNLTCTFLHRSGQLVPLFLFKLFLFYVSFLSVTFPFLSLFEDDAIRSGSAPSTVSCLWVRAQSACVMETESEIYIVFDVTEASAVFIKVLSGLWVQSDHLMITIQP